MYPEKNKFFKHIDFIILDILCMEVSLIVAYFLRHRNFSLFDNSAYRSLLIILIIANLLSCNVFDTMRDVLKRSKQLEFYSTVKQVLFTTAILLAYIYFIKIGDEISRNTIIMFPIIYLVLSYVIRLAYKYALIKHFESISRSDESRLDARHVVIIADKKNAERLIKKFSSGFGDIVIDFIIQLDYDSDPCSKILFFPVLGGVDSATKNLQTRYVDEVIISAENRDVSELMQKISLMGIVLHIELPGEFDFISDNSKLLVESISDINFITSTVNTISPLQLFAKRGIDIIFGIIGTIITLILAIIIGPIIKLKSKGPIFFKQDRVGKNGKIFKMIKFRSMVIDADELKEKYKAQNENKDGLMFKMTNDPRVIPGIGEFIRKTSIDEFPQFINVLKGEMSVVGTRPPTIDEWEKYDLHHRARLAIKPGITGLWQVSGRSDIKDFEDVVKLDTKYIKTFSLWQDFSIILKTIKVVLNKEGAR